MAATVLEFPAPSREILTSNAETVIRKPPVLEVLSYQIDSPIESLMQSSDIYLLRDRMRDEVDRAIRYQWNNLSEEAALNKLRIARKLLDRIIAIKEAK